jgi:glycosyltransferase involved in cell wall biosynthesis
MNKKPKIIAVLIAYKAEETLEKFWTDLPKEYFDEIILVDDASDDKTFEIAKRLKGLKVYQNQVNLGYGGNLKRALAIALDLNADIIVDIHPDGEYKPSAISPALEKLQKEGYGLVMGNRFANINKLSKSGIYVWKLLPLLALNYIAKQVLGIDISDFHQGFRVYTRKLFEKINFEENSNNYLFSFELIAQSAFNKIKISEIPVETSYQGEKRGASLKNSIIYSLDTLRVLALYLLAIINFKTAIFKKPKKNLEFRISKLL